MSEVVAAMGDHAPPQTVSSMPSSSRSIVSGEQFKPNLFQSLARPHLNLHKPAPNQKDPPPKEFDTFKQAAETAGKYSGLMSNIQEKECDGVYIIDTGRCKVVNPYDNHQFTSLTRGDYFGENHFLKIPVRISIS